MSRPGSGITVEKQQGKCRRTRSSASRSLVDRRVLKRRFVDRAVLSLFLRASFPTSKEISKHASKKYTRRRKRKLHCGKQPNDRARSFRSRTRVVLLAVSLSELQERITND